jgi:hypothetical protein
MLANNFVLLNDNFDNEWNTLGFKRRVEELAKNRNHMMDFKALVRLLNFYCERCMRLGCVTGYCDNHKSDPVAISANSAWTAAFNEWRQKRAKGENKSKACYETETGSEKPDTQGIAQPIIGKTSWLPAILFVWFLRTQPLGHVQQDIKLPSPQVYRRPVF